QTERGARGRSLAAHPIPHRHLIELYARHDGGGLRSLDLGRPGAIAPEHSHAKTGGEAWPHSPLAAAAISPRSLRLLPRDRGLFLAIRLLSFPATTPKTRRSGSKI